MGMWGLFSNYLMDKCVLHGWRVYLYSPVCHWTWIHISKKGTGADSKAPAQWGFSALLGGISPIYTNKCTNRHREEAHGSCYSVLWSDGGWKMCSRKLSVIPSYWMCLWRTGLHKPSSSCVGTCHTSAAAGWSLCVFIAVASWTWIRKQQENTQSWLTCFHNSTSSNRWISLN